MSFLKDLISPATELAGKFIQDKHEFFKGSDLTGH